MQAAEHTSHLKHWQDESLPSHQGSLRFSDELIIWGSLGENHNARLIASFIDNRATLPDHTELEVRSEVLYHKMSHPHQYSQSNGAFLVRSVVQPAP